VLKLFDLSGRKCSVHNLKRILDLNAKINSTLKIDELLSLIMSTAAGVVNSEVASLLLLDDERKHLVFRVALGEKGGELVEKFRVKVGEGIAGHVAQKGEAVIVNDTAHDPRFAKRFDKETGFVSKAILCVPLTAKGAVTGVLEAINPVGRAKFSPADLELFQAFADQAAIAVENAKLHGEILKQEKAKQELLIAREIQQNFLPDLAAPRFPVDIAARNIPALEVSGDFYDVMPLSESRTGVLIADVSGKGVPAALFMVNAISNFRFLASRLASPAALLPELNNRLAKSSTRGMFVTLLYMVFDLRQKTLEYASAGHPAGIVRTRTGSIEELAPPGGLPLGLVEDAGYSQDVRTLSAGETFVFYTDGISEARNRQGEEYTLPRLKHCLNAPRTSAENYAAAIISDLGAFTQGAAQHDDITALVVQVPDALPQP
jgi:sigma-B regulation protein RsbU (phosphoserine phosphatase)